MFKKSVRCFFSVAVAGVFCAVSAFADQAALEKKIDALEKKVESQGAQLEKLESQPASPSGNATSDTTLGGYGEIAYNGYRKDSNRNQLDLKRFVLYVGHRFNDAWTFNGEVEWEHAIASSDDAGETEVEQAYLNYQFKPGANLKTGLFLMPFGFINESHEPPMFYGVERNEVETRIIPTTWREGGVSFVKSTDGGLEANVGLTTGFDMAKFDDASEPLASVHQELQLAKAQDLSYYGALNYRGLPGFNLGGAIFSGDSMHNNADFQADNTLPDFTGIDARVTLWEAHTRWQKSGWDLEALYAEGHIGQADLMNQVIDTYNTANATDRPFVPKQFNGWLVQGAYTIWQRGDVTLTPFVRYEQFDTQQKMPDGFAADPVNKDAVTTFGFSFKPLTQIVFKTDYQSYRDNHLNDRFNVGMGYMF